MLVGILVDVSGSMESSLKLNVEVNGDNITRAQSIFTTIMNIVDVEVKFSENQRVFVVAFGLQDVCTCDLLSLLDHIQELGWQSRHGNAHGDLVQLLSDNGAPYTEEYVRKYVSQGQAQFLFNFYSQYENRYLLKDIVNRLPLVCKSKDPIIRGAKGAVWAIDKIGAMLSQESIEERKAAEKVQEAMKHAMDGMRQEFIPKLKLMETPKTKTFQETVNLLRRVSGSSASGSDMPNSLVSRDLSALTESIEAFIYGNTPMCRALTSALEQFHSAIHQQKVLFLLSDGESTDGDPVRYVEQLRDEQVLVLACLLTSRDIAHPRQLTYKPDRDWSQGQRQMFDLSSTIDNTHPALSVLLQRGWKLDRAGHSRLFIQANRPQVIEEFTNLVQQISQGHGVLLSMIGRVKLDKYINSNIATFEPKRQRGGTCYAHAVAAVFHLATRRIVGYEGGHPEFELIRDQLINAYGQAGAHTEEVLRVWAPKYRLHYKKTDESGAREAVSRRRPVVATFRLDEGQWKNFSAFYQNHPQGVLQSKDLGSTTAGAKVDGHAVVLIKCDPDYLTFLNSWGTEFADGGFFRVENQSTLGLQFYDVYWILTDLKQSEIEAFQKQSAEEGQHWIEKLPSGIKNLDYECPHCHQSSAIQRFKINFADAECPLCHERFKPRALGINVARYTH